MSDSQDPMIYAYEFIRVDDLMQELRAGSSAQCNRDRYNGQIRLLINHPHVTSNMQDLYEILANGLKKGFIDQPTSVLVSEKYPQLTQMMIPQTPRALVDNTAYALRVAIEYPEMFLNNVGRTHPDIATRALQSKSVFKRFMVRSYSKRLEILGKLFLQFKGSRGALDDLFSAVAIAGEPTPGWDIPNAIPAQDLTQLLNQSHPQQYTHHVLMAWSMGLICNLTAINQLNTPQPNNPYTSSHSDLMHYFNTLVSTYSSMVYSVQEEAERIKEKEAARIKEKEAALVREKETASHIHEDTSMSRSSTGSNLSATSSHVSVARNGSVSVQVTPICKVRSLAQHTGAGVSMPYATTTPTYPQYQSYHLHHSRGQ